MQPIIRRMQSQDIGAIANILRKIEWFVQINNESEEKTYQRVFKNLELCNKDNSHSVYVALSKYEEICGYISVHWNPYLFLPGPEGYVSELFVHPKYQGRGIGTSLLEKVKQEASERGCYRLTLINNRIRESYEKGFYKKNGWEERAQMANFVYIINKG